MRFSICLRHIRKPIAPTVQKHYSETSLIQHSIFIRQVVYLIFQVFFEFVMSRHLALPAKGQIKKQLDE